MKTQLRDNQVSLRLSHYYKLLAICAVFLGNLSYAGPLDDYARENGGTQLQIDIAEAVNRICPSLVGGVFGGLGNALAAPESSEKDITLRCNELVLTAIDLDGGSPSRTLGYTDGDDLLVALQQVTGEEVAAQNTMTSRAANSQFSNISARLGSLRLAAAGAGTTGPATAVNFEVDDVGLDSVVAGMSNEMLGGGASADESGLKRAGFFINATTNTGDRSPTTVEDGFDFDVFGATLGFDYSFDSGVLGASIGYDKFEADFQVTDVVSGGDIGADGFSASVFGLKTFGNFFIDGIATYGELDYDIDRILEYASETTDPDCQCPSQSRTLVSDSSGDHFSASVSAGWYIYANKWMIQPTLGLSTRTYNIDGYTEVDTAPTGGMELRYGDQEIDSLRATVGLHFSRAIPRKFGILRPWFGLEWYHEFEDDPTVLSAKYAEEDSLAVDYPDLAFGAGLTDCLSCFEIRSDAPDTDFGVVGVGLNFVFPNFKQLLFYYEGLVGYDDLTSHAFTINFRTQF